MRKKAAAFLLCVAVLLGACLLLRVGGAAWKNSQLEAGFTPSGKYTNYQERVPMEEMDLAQYDFLWVRMVTAQYTPMDFTLQRDLAYYDRPGGEAAYTIPAGTQLWWDSFRDCVATYPTYDKGWRWARPMAPEGEDPPEEHYYVPLASLQSAWKDLYATNEIVEQRCREAGLSPEEAARQILLQTDEEFYRRGVCVSPDLRAPLWGWDCTLLAGGCALAAGAWAAVLRRRKMRKEN